MITQQKHDLRIEQARACPVGKVTPATSETHINTLQVTPEALSCPYVYTKTEL